MTHICTDELTATSSQSCEYEAALTPVVLKERAEAILDSLARAKSECERHMASMRRVDLLKAVTGSSAIERAMDETRRTITALESRADSR